jgi:hypothetical protein
LAIKRLTTTSPSSPASVRRHEREAVLAQRQLCAELLEQAQFVGHEPAFRDPAIGEAKYPDLVYVHLAPGR